LCNALENELTHNQIQNQTLVLKNYSAKQNPFTRPAVTTTHSTSTNVTGTTDERGKFQLKLKTHVLPGAQNNGLEERRENNDNNDNKSKTNQKWEKLGEQQRMKILLKLYNMPNVSNDLSVTWAQSRLQELQKQ